MTEIEKLVRLMRYLVIGAVAIGAVYMVFEAVAVL
jgi:hypothetical protein